MHTDETLRLFDNATALLGTELRNSVNGLVQPLILGNSSERLKLTPVMKARKL
jgi:hypothetical protein